MQAEQYPNFQKAWRRTGGGAPKLLICDMLSTTNTLALVDLWLAHLASSFQNGDI